VSIDLALPAQRAWAAMSRGHTNAINRANRAGFRVEISPAGQRVNEFTAVFADTLQRLGAAETYHFSDEYLARLAAMNEAFVAVAYYCSRRSTWVLWRVCAGRGGDRGIVRG
jgi:hypothetical protein